MKINKSRHKPIISEKSLRLGVNNEYVFRVNLKASKNAVAAAVEDLFNVDVTKVRTMIVPGKKKRVGKTRIFTKTPKWKKAVVKLKEGQKIKLFPEEQEK